MQPVPNLIHPNQTCICPLNESTIKVPQLHKIWDKCLQFLQMSGLFPIFSVFLQLYLLRNDMEVIRYHNLFTKIR